MLRLSDRALYALHIAADALVLVLGLGAVAFVVTIIAAALSR